MDLPGTVLEMALPGTVHQFMILSGTVLEMALPGTVHCTVDDPVRDCTGDGPAWDCSLDRR